MPCGRNRASSVDAMDKNLNQTVLPGDRKLNVSAEMLLDTTARLLSERGVKNVSLADISKASALNSALIKYYFGNKEGLFLQLLERDAAKSMNALNELVAMPVSAALKIKIHISGIVNAYFRSPYLNQLIHFMIESAQEASSKRVSQIYVQPMVAAYAKIIGQGMDEGLFRFVDAGMMYHSLVGACDHIFHAAYSANDTLGSAKITEDIKQRYILHLTRLFLDGVLLRT